MTRYQNDGIIGNNKWKYYISYAEVKICFNICFKICFKIFNELYNFANNLIVLLHLYL